MDSFETYIAKMQLHQNICNINQKFVSSHILITQISVSQPIKSYYKISKALTNEIKTVESNYYCMSGDCQNVVLVNQLNSTNQQLNRSNKFANILYETFHENSLSSINEDCKSFLKDLSDDDNDEDITNFALLNQNLNNDMAHINVLNVQNSQLTNVQNSQLTNVKNQIQDCFIEIDDQLSEEHNEVRKISEITKKIKPNATKFSEEEDFIFSVVYDIFEKDLSLYYNKPLLKSIHFIFNEEKGNGIKNLLNKLLSELDKETSYKTPDKEFALKIKDKCKSKLVQSQTIKKPAKDASKSSLNDILEMFNSTTNLTKQQENKVRKYRILDNESEPLPSYFRLNSDSNKSHFSNIIKSHLKPSSQISSNLDLPYQHLLNTVDPYKILVLKPFDEILKSHFSPTDRRLLSIAKKMNVKIEIFGPIKVAVTAPSFYASRDKITFHCLIIGQHKSDLIKCLKCIRDSFPSSNMREI